MKMCDMVSWYQKKIATYDKELWEKTVEEKILYSGFGGGVGLKTAKLKTDLIDVDLVRGSTFPKAKPKQSLLTVLRLAVLRFLFLPLYTRWWMCQTCSSVFLLLLTLYTTQLVNWIIYTLHQHSRGGHFALEINGTMDFDMQSKISKTAFLSRTPETNSPTGHSIISLSDLLIPMTLSLFLSLIHSQIVATNNFPSGCSKSSSSKRRRFSNANASSSNWCSYDVRKRRRKKLFKIRNQELQDGSGIFLHVPSGVQEVCDGDTRDCGPENHGEQLLNRPPDLVQISQSCVDESPSRVLHSTVHRTRFSTSMVDLMELVDSRSLLNGLECVEVEQSTFIDTLNDEDAQEKIIRNTGLVDQDGFNATKSVRINDCIQEVNCNCLSLQQQLCNAACEDDGFESFNGKSSSGEETTFYSLTNLDQYPHQIQRKSQKQIAVKSRIIENNYSSCKGTHHNSKDIHFYKSGLHARKHDESSDDTDLDGDNNDFVECGEDHVHRHRVTQAYNTFAYNNECTTSATEWMGITTNSEECSYSSDMNNSDDYRDNRWSDYKCEDMDFTPATILNPRDTSDRISCTIWEQGEIKKAQMSVLEISSRIIEKVESMPETHDYVYIGIALSVLLSFIPCFYHLCEVTFDYSKYNELSFTHILKMLWDKGFLSLDLMSGLIFGYQEQWQRVIFFLSIFQRFALTLMLFMILSVAERTFKQRFLYAKLFSRLTSSRRARKSNLPHFRLNKVRNIKTWLSVRSYLKKRGPQRSVDVIVSGAFLLTLLLLGFLSIEWLKDSTHLHSHLNIEALAWASSVGIFVLRYMTLGNKTHHKYRSVSVLITEQINLYLQIEKKPKKKEDLMVSNSVLKLAADLLKELETPFKISGLSANPFLFTTIKVVILSALSGVLSEMLGFKLKLHKIKIK